MTPRETYYAALVSQLETLVTNGAIKRLARKVTLKDINNPPKLPCLYIDTDKELVEHQAGQKAKLLITVRLFAFVAAPDNNATPDTDLSDLLDAIDTALAPLPGVPFQTLGGIVTHCWIEGEIERFEAGVEGKALAIVPVHMLTTR